MSSVPREFKPDYYDGDYFVTPKGKKYQKPDGSIEGWSYANPQGEFFGAAAIAKAWKEVFKPQRLLDVGCGRGTFVAYARDQGIEAFGFDYSPWAIENRYPRCNPNWINVWDATKIPWEGEPKGERGTSPYLSEVFDLVVALDFFEHIYQQENLGPVIDEMFRVSKKWIFLQIATVDGKKEKEYMLKKGDPVPIELEGYAVAGHVNVQTQQYWYDQFDREGWLPRRDMVMWFCSLVDPRIIANWIKNTIMVLEKI